MKFAITRTFILLIILLAGVNVYLMTRSMALEDETRSIEQKIAELRIANLQLNNEVSRRTSLEFLDQVAAQLDFDETTETLHFGDLKRAEL